MKLLQLLLLGLSACIVAGVVEFTSLPTVGLETVTHKLYGMNGKVLYPRGCIWPTTCTYMVSWIYLPHDNEIEYTVLSKQRINDTIAIGFTDLPLEQNGLIDLIYGFMNETHMTAEIVDAWIVNRNGPVEIDSEQDLLHPMDLVYKDGWMNLTFSRYRNLTDPKDLSFEDKCNYFVLPIDGVKEVLENGKYVKKLGENVVLSLHKICIGPNVGVTEPTESLLTMKTEKPLGVHEKLTTILPEMITPFDYDNEDFDRTLMWMLPKHCHNKSNPEECVTFVWIQPANETITLTHVSKLYDGVPDGKWIAVGFKENRNTTGNIIFIVAYITKDGKTKEVFNGYANNINDAPVNSNNTELLSSSVWCEDGFMFMNATFKRELINYTCPYVVIPLDGGKVNDDGTLKKPTKPMYVTEKEACLDVIPNERPHGIETGKKIVVTFDISATKLTGEALFTPENLDPSLFNVLFLNYANISNDNMLIPADPTDTDVYDKINKLKEQNTELETLLTILVEHRFIDMLKTPEARHTFINSSIELLEKHNFTGLNLLCHSSRLTDKDMLKDIITELNEKFEKTGLFVTLTVSSNVIIMEKINLNEIHDQLEYIVVLTDMLYNRSVNVTTHHCPLFINPPYTMNSMESVMNLAAQNAPKEKLIGTVSPFGRGYTLVDPNNHEVGAPTVGLSPPGPYTMKEGVLSYYEICEMLNMTAKSTWLTIEHVPVMINGSSWVGYDNVRSVKEKVEWLKSNDFGGVVLHGIHLDDFNGTFCGEGKFPLLQALRKTLIGIGNMTGTVPPLSKILHSTENLLNTGKLVTHLPILHNTEKVVTHLPILHNTGKMETNTEKVVTNLHNTEKVLTHLPTEHITEKVVTKHE